jgi:thiamine-phosphate pyrophosphorylase
LRPKVDLALYALVDPQIARGRTLATLARTAAVNGATLVQLRAKDMATRAMIAEALEIKAALAGTGVPFLVNDRVDVALAAGADGVHLGRDDMAPATARRLLGAGAIIGATIKASSDLAALDGAPVDYGTIGGVFQTRHKDNADAPVGLDGLRRLRQEARAMNPRLPISAIAGIEEGNAVSVIAAGADGIAVIGALFGGDDVAARTQRLAAIVRKALAERGGRRS